MNLFHIIDDGVAILLSRGAYRQAKIYRRGHQLFAQYGAGYVRLLRHGGTSVPSVAYLEVEGPNVNVINGLPSYSEPFYLAAE